MKCGFCGKRWPDFLDEEIQEYIEHETRDNIERGMSPEEARSAALRKFGNMTRIREDTRAVWNAVWFEQLLQDISYGFRMLRRNPGFSTVVILTLALGIGMNTAMFSVMDAALLHHIAYPDPDRLIWVATYDTGYQSEHDTRVVPSDYAAFKEHAPSFQSMTAYGNQDLALVYGGDGAAERIASLTGDFWSITGAQPAFGRLFSLGEPHAMVLSWQLFERRFNSDPRVIGKTVAVDGYPFHITGVLPKSFRFLFPQQLYSDDDQRDIDAYIAVPNAVPKLPSSAYRLGSWEKVIQTLGPTPPNFFVVGKLKSDVPFERGRAELQAIYERSVRYHMHSALRVQPLQKKLIGNVRPALLVLAGAVGFVLLIVCANVANLLLARASARQQEIAIRAALGAARSRLMRQFLTESILSALAGAAAGLVLARWAIAIMVRLGSGAVPRLSETRIDGWVLLFTLAVSLLAAVLFGLGPATSLWRAHVHDSLKQETATSSASAGRLRLREVLVALEVAMAVVLLSGAGLMLKSFWRMNAFPPGFAPEKILVTKISLSGPQYQTWPQQHAYIDELFHRIESVPGVQVAGIHCSTFNTTITVEGAPPDNQPFAAIEYVSPGYLRAMGVSLLEGHWPTENESLDVVVVNESFARRVTTAGNLIGKHIHAALLSARIVGIVPNFKVSKLDAEPVPQIYAAYQMSPRISLVTAMVRMSGDPKPMAPEIRKLISGIDQNVPAYRIETLEQELADSIAPRRFNMFLLSSFAAAALLLAMIGIYGVIAYSVAQRTHEIGIRMALGAQRLEVVGMVIRQGMAITLAGIVAGLLAALGLTRLMASLLYGVKPNDPPTFLVVATSLAVIALLACWGPALKAALVDPIVALRYE